MLSRASVCLRCQFEAFSLSYRSQQSHITPWVQQRTLATAQRGRRTPSRMILTDDVSKPPSDAHKTDKRKERQAGPFGGMNRTEAVFTGRHAQRSMAEQKRSSGGKDAPKSDDKKKKDKPTFHALKMQTTLTPISYHQRGIIKEKLENIEKFEEFDLLDSVGEAIYSQALPGLVDVAPTPAQKLLIPALLESSERISSQPKRRTKIDASSYSQFLLAAETGSGKTLAYTLPIIDAIKRSEGSDEAEEVERIARKKEMLRKTNELDPFEEDNPPHRTTGRPKAIILVPSAELVTQIGKLLKQLAHTVKFRSAAVSAKTSPKYIANNLFNRKGIDILVTTPHLISSIAKTEPNVFSRVSYLVVDEADSLLDRSFSPTTLEILDKVTPSLKQLILCSATIPKSMNNLLDQRFPNVRRLVTPRLHSIPRRVQLGVIDVDRGGLYRGNKSIACADIIWSVGKSNHEDNESHHAIKHMMVFVNERETAEEVASFLVTKGIDAVALTRDTPEERQSEILETFTARSRQEGDKKDEIEGQFLPFEEDKPKKQTTSSSSLEAASSSSSKSGPTGKKLPNVKVLVTTDLGSRGIDTLAVRTVILYDVPHTTIDFIHRLGRLGRMGRRGRGIVLVGKQDRKDVVREVQDGMFKGQALI